MTEGSLLFALFIWAIVGGLVGTVVGNIKGRPEAGFFFGLLLGPLGWLVIALGPNFKPKCPECGGEIVEGARRCKNCGGALEKKTQVEGG